MFSWLDGQRRAGLKSLVHAKLAKGREDTRRKSTCCPSRTFAFFADFA
jgi:hypothetical protein